LADDDPEMTLVRLAKEEEGVGISMGAHLAGVRSAMLMQEPRVSCGRERHRVRRAALSHSAAHVDQRPGSFGERDPWQTEGGLVTEHVLDSLRIPRIYLDAQADVARTIAHAQNAGVLGKPARRASARPRPDVGGLMAMLRREAMAAVFSDLERQGTIVVTIMGAVAAELQEIGHRPNFFYLQHAMGLASSMGLGIALSRPELRVIVFDGDGSLLMNLGGLTTMARYRPKNLVHVVFDNESLLSVGGFPTATSTGSDLAEIAKAAGVPRTATVRTVDEFTRAFREALEVGDLTTIVAKVEAVGPKAFVTDLSLLENRYEFQRHLKNLRT
jgi:sulfopyruvate decarboxylase subunit beta